MKLWNMFSWTVKPQTLKKQIINTRINQYNKNGIQQYHNHCIMWRKDGGTAVPVTQGRALLFYGWMAEENTQNTVNGRLSRTYRL